MKVGRMIISILLMISAIFALYVWKSAKTVSTAAPWLVGQPCPAWKVSDLSGTRLIGDFATGRPLVVILGSQKCDACARLLTALTMLLDDINKKADILVLEWPIGDQPSTGTELLLQAGLQAYEVTDTSQIHGFILPTILVIDSQNTVAFDLRGWHPNIWQIVSSVLDTA